MTRKDYELIADAINAVPTPANFEQIVKIEIVNQLVLRLENDNPRFNQLKFREACGV